MRTQNIYLAGDKCLKQKKGNQAVERIQPLFAVIESNHSTFDSTTLMKRPMRIRTQGVVGAGGENPPATQFGIFSPLDSSLTD